MTAPNVTERNSAPCSAEFADPRPERETSSETLHPAITDSDRRPFDGRAWMARFGAYCTPPPILTQRRPALDTLRDYARRGRYTESLNGGVRALGMAWYRGVAVPVTVAVRYVEWLFERPARFLVVAATVKALTFLPPVGWLVDHIIRPACAAAAWVLL